MQPLSVIPARAGHRHGDGRKTEPLPRLSTVAECSIGRLRVAFGLGGRIRTAGCLVPGQDVYR